MTEQLVNVFHGDSLMEAEMIKGLLEAEGILCQIPGELAQDGFTAARQVTGGRHFDVRVAASSLARARSVIERAIEDGKRLEGYLAEHPAEGDEDA